MDTVKILVRGLKVREEKAETFRGLAPGEIACCTVCSCRANFRGKSTRKTESGPVEVKAYFYSNEHEPDCRIAKKSKPITVREHTLKLTQINRIIGAEEPAERTGPGGGGAGRNCGGDGEGPVDVTIPEKKKGSSTGYSNAKTIYDAMDGVEEDAPVDGIRKGDFLVDGSSIGFFREEGIFGVHEVVARPCSPGNLKYPINKPYKVVFLRDAYTDFEDEENAIYYMLSFDEERVFRKWLDKLKRVPRGKVVVAIGDFHRFENDHYLIYQCRVKNSKCIGIARPHD